MAVDTGSKERLEAFAQGNGLPFAPSASLPADGHLLSAGGTVEGAVEGALPGGLEGTVAYYVYTTSSTDSDGHTSTEHHRFTILVTRLPESIGFAPYLSYGGRGSSIGVDLSQGIQQLKLLEGDAFKGAHLYAYDGSSKSWLAQLFSPALIDWLARSPDGFGFELSGGVLCAARDGYLTDTGDIESLCSDAAHVAGAIRKESVEGVESGAAASEGAHAHAPDPKAERALAAVVGDDAPEYLGATTKAFRGHALRSPGTWIMAIAGGLVIWAIFNVFGLALTINWLNNGNSTTPLIIGEAVFLVLCTIPALRWKVRDQVSVLDPEAFFRGYASSRHLKVEDPLQFAATHAEAKLPFEPAWVFSGALPGGSGDAAMALKGDGTKRADQIAVIAGTSGPVASSELQASAPGLSLADLDGYAGRLSQQLAGAPAAA